jgi:CubicO group peptidase (beta-lactamase class C family)
MRGAAVKVLLGVWLLSTMLPSALMGAEALAPAAGATAARELAGASDTLLDASVKPLRDALAPLVDNALERFGIPALSVVLVRGDRILWAEGFGFADPGHGIRAGADTRYRVGSLAKPFTALAVLGLEAAGQLDIDQPLSAYLEGFSVRRHFSTTVDPITVRSVLSHHAGLPSDLNKGLWSATPFTQVAIQLKDEYAAFPPNLVFAYSNVGYTLLGDMVQQVAGEPFEAYVEERLFRPFGMTHTRFAQLPSPAEPIAIGHQNGRAVSLLPIRDLPAQGLETSATDLGRFISLLLCGGSLDGRQVLAPDLIEAMMQPQNDDIALDLDVTTGLGWFLEQGSIAGAERVVRHGGATLAYTAELVMLPEEGLGIAVLANAGSAHKVVSQLAKSVLTQSLKLMPEPLPSDLLLADDQARPPADAMIDSTGRYATDFGLISIRTEDAKLCACMTGETLDLIASPQGWFGVGGTGDVGAMAPASRTLTKMRLQTRRIDGRDVVVAHTGDGEVVIGEKIPPEPAPDAWLARLGRYRVVNEDAGFPVQDLELKLNQGQLCMSYRMPLLSANRVQVPLRAISDHQAILLGLGRTRGDTVRFEQRDGRLLLRYSGYLAEPVATADEAQMTGQARSAN